ncbi:MAG: dicarboxylate/amino acid:cation symporter [Rhodospirillaceae bacterium]|nr:dicarboxylate/amino acid:cation symporter [Rhodospirillaceae bacterium]
MTPHVSPRFSLTNQIMIGVILGGLTGWLIHQYGISPEQKTMLAGYITIISDVFLRLIKMIIGPLVLATLITGIAQKSDGSDIGTLFWRTIVWFVLAGLVSLLLGMVMVDLLQPGVGVALPPAAAETGAVNTSTFTLRGFIAHIFPTSIAQALAQNEVLQIVVFSLFAGVTLKAMDDRARPVLDVLDVVGEMMLRITSAIMRVAPYAVFAAIASVVAVQGLEVIATFARLVVGFYAALAILWALLFAVGVAFLGLPDLRRLAKEVREAFLITFATASSEASYPKFLSALERFGVRPRVASFMLPLGYAFNLDGSMMYCAFASLFIAQAYGIDLSLSQQIAMLLMLMVTSKGIAGVPRASLVIVAATLPAFNIPAEGLLVVLAVDHFLDMGRSATNIIGNAVAIAALDRWDTRRTASL